MAVAAGELSLTSSETRAEAPPAAASEAGLVERCRAGDPVAFARLVALHEGMVFNLAVRLLGDAEEARDVAQDVFLQVYRMLGRFEGRSSLKTWIYRIVMNHCRNRQRFWRRRRREASMPIEDLSPRDEAKMAAYRGAGTSPFDGVERRERSQKVQAALSRLSFEHRAVLLLREVEDLPGEAVAAALGVAVGTVKSRLARAREALRLRLSEVEKEAVR
jgi:RNA polymerase sigma-70 factor (ECF subfamily)